MTLTEALASPVYRFYALVAVALLAGAGLTLAALRWGLGRDVEHAWKSFRAWLVMVPVVLGVVLLGRGAVIFFFTLLALMAFKEFARATGLYGDWLMTGTVSLGIAAVGLVTWVPQPRQDLPGWYGLFMALPVYVIAAILVIPILRNRAKGQLQACALAIVGFIYFGWMFGHLAFLANARLAYAYLLYLLLAVEVNDVAAYAAGRLFGRRPLRSHISPKKTWEGALGGLAVSMALPWALRFTFPHFTAWDCILLGLRVGVGGQLGDLAISTIKRDLGIKDMGAAIPGHGGILDRVDSLVYVAPLFFHITRWHHGIY